MYQKKRKFFRKVFKICSHSMFLADMCMTDVLADYVEHVVDLRWVGQVGSQLASMSELQEQDHVG